MLCRCTDELPVPVLATYVGKTKKIERLRFSFTLAFAVLGRKPTKLDQPRLVLMEFQVELRKSFPSSAKNRSASSRC